MKKLKLLLVALFNINATFIGSNEKQLCEADTVNFR